MPLIAACLAAHAEYSLPQDNWQHLAARLFGPAAQWLSLPRALMLQQGEAHPAAFSTVLHGWIDNLDELCAALGCPGLGAAQAYEQAVLRWGDGADARIIGSYSAISLLGDGTLRLARSPWAAMPLLYTQDSTRALAASGVQALFAAGHKAEVDQHYLTDTLAMDYHEADGATFYRDVRKVPLGAIVRLQPGREDVRRWYDPQAIPRQSFRREEEWVEAATALLDEASRKALAPAHKPGLMLSGGLDSPIVAASLLRSLPGSQRLPTFTFLPDAQWDGILPDGLMGDEGPLVRDFAARHPRIEAHFAPRDEGGFDHGLRDLLRAGGGYAGNVANIGVFHGPWRMAKEAGCDWLFNAELGNFTFSNRGEWAYPEYLARGRWRALWQALHAFPHDPRSLPRRFLAHAVLPLLPRPLRRAVRRAVHPGWADLAGHATLLSPAARTRQRADARKAGRHSYLEDYGFSPSRRAWIAAAWASADSGEELDFSLEQLYGVRRRDITAYRPFVEFCLSLPTHAFIAQRQDRRLAREMGRGILSEEHRLDTRHGRHNVDWHVRIGRRREELSAYAERMRDHPFLAEAIDIDRVQALLADWPEQTPWEPHEALPRAFALTRALTAAMFVGHVEGRNDL